MPALNICGIPYILGLAKPGEVPEDEYGHCNRLDCVILVQPGLTPVRFVDILLHECMHASLWEMGHAGRRLPEEETCIVAGRAMAALFSLNPDLLPAIGRLLNGDLPSVTREDFARAFDRA